MATLFGFQLRTTGGHTTTLRDSIYWSSYPWSAGFCADWTFPDMSVTEQLREHLGDEADCEREALALHGDAARFEAALARFLATGKPILRVGTDNSDDYYPSFVSRWEPNGIDDDGYTYV